MTQEQMQQIAADKAEEKYSKAIHKVCYYSGFLDGLTYSKWIAVEDGLPDTKRLVMVSIDIQGANLSATDWARYFEETETWANFNNEPLPAPYKVTAWQEKPESYKK